jgi:hypothetical protein
LALARTLANALREQQGLVSERANGLACRSGTTERCEQVPDAALNLFVGVQDDAPFWIIDESSGQAETQVATACRVEHATPHPAAKDVELRLRKRPLHAE